MSGRIVGEVKAAAGTLRGMGLSRPAYWALVMIAEEAREDRRGRISQEELADAMWVSVSTVKRAVAELVETGLVEVVERGFRRGNGQALSTLYRVAALPALIGPARPAPCGTVPSTVHGELLTPSSTGHGELLTLVSTAQNEVSTAHLDELLPVVIPVREGGGYVSGEPHLAREDREDPTTGDHWHGDAPPARCPRHAGDPRPFIPTPCAPCASQRAAHARWQGAAAEREAAHERARLAVIDACSHCDPYGLRELPDGRVARCDHAARPQHAHTAPAEPPPTARPSLRSLFEAHQAARRHAAAA